MLPAGSELLEQLVRYGVLTAEDQRPILAHWPEAAFTNADIASGWLIEQGKLTPFQLGLIRKGAIAEIVLGNYVILDKIGAGGMGTVFKARHRRMKRVVALKVLPQELSQSEIFVQRFLREMEAAARMTHPNIVTAYDADEDNGRFYLAMEYVAGIDLATWVRHRGPMATRDAAQCIIHAANGMAYAHEQGVVHRDIKPSNLLRDQTGQVKIADLGLARFVDDSTHRSNNFEREQLTHTGSFSGTIDYMSPEQALDTNSADARSDIYSLGCTLYYLLVGSPPYQGNSIVDVLLAHRDQPIPDVREARPDIPATLANIYERMMAKRPAQRFAKMEQVAQELRNCLGQLQVRPPTSMVETSSVSPSGGNPSADGATANPATSLKRRLASLSIGSLQVLLVEPSRAQSVVIGGYLRKLGIQLVHTCSMGQQALDQVQLHPPHLVVSSMHLPDMDGTTLSKRIHADPRCADVAVILITAAADQKLLNEVRDSATIAVLQKPFTVEQLQATLNALLRGASKSTARSGKTEGMRDLKVLIVDDSGPARRLLRTLLSELGISRFGVALHGQHAVEILETEVFDLVVSDYHMPEMNGLELVRFIRQQSRQKTLPVLMVTSESDPGVVAALKEAGANAILGKDLDLEKMRATLAEIVPS